MTGSLINELQARMAQPAPEVGMGCTVCAWTDRYACTIIEVSKSGKSLVCQRDKAIRTDNNHMSECQEYSYERNPNGQKFEMRLNKWGRWVEKGCRDGYKCSLGHRDEYYDYSF
jgi:hypothetical protein